MGGGMGEVRVHFRTTTYWIPEKTKSSFRCLMR